MRGVVSGSISSSWGLSSFGVVRLYLGMVDQAQEEVHQFVLAEKVVSLVSFDDGMSLVPFLFPQW